MTPSNSQCLLDDTILYNLNRLNIGFVKKRIIRELNEFSKSGAHIHVEYEENFARQNNSNIIITIIPKEADTIYHFTITNDYPLKPPSKFKVNYKDYKRYLQINSPKTIDELRKYNNINCLCCNTIYYIGNWRPSLSMHTFINEFKQMKKHRRDIINRLLATKIVNKYLIPDINIIQWLL
jgi:ubiquitin-protein ligase